MKKYIPLLFFCLLFSCSVQNFPKASWITYNLQINAFGEDSLLQTKSAYIMFPEKKNNYLENQEMQKYIINALKQKGYLFTDALSDADVLIAADYNVKRVVNRFNEKIPTSYTTVPVKSTSQQTDEKAPKTNKTTVYNSNTETKYAYDKVVTGYTVVTDSAIEYCCYYNLTAYSKQLYIEKNPSAELWSTSVISRGKNDDLRYMLPFMLFGSYKYIGHSSGKKISTWVTAEEHYLLFRTIKGI